MRIQRRAGRGRLVLLVFLALSVGLITLDFRENEGGVIERAKDLSAAVVEPVQRGFATVFRPVGDFFASVGELGSLRSENARLDAEVKELRALRQEAESILDENARLRAELELDESWASMDRVAAEVFNKEPSNWHWAYTIDKGRVHGVRKDMTVINDRGFVGKIVDVAESSSTVLLAIDPESGVSAKIEGKGYSGTVTGHGAGRQLQLEFIDIDANVEPGDVIVTSRIGGIFPPNVPIGFVSTVEGDAAGTEQVITIEPYVDFTALDFVQVLLESGPRAQEAAS
ncbi:MAG TPA: rod shape-determining protein MreC [Actinomycetota bacterium]|nr:rod shape-determining protein MreC [Actinomycetota bacterium]